MFSLWSMILGWEVATSWGCSGEITHGRGCELIGRWKGRTLRSRWALGQAWWRLSISIIKNKIICGYLYHLELLISKIILVIFSVIYCLSRVWSMTVSKINRSVDVIAITLLFSLRISLYISSRHIVCILLLLLFQAYKSLPVNIMLPVCFDI